MTRLQDIEKHTLFTAKVQEERQLTGFGETEVGEWLDEHAYYFDLYHVGLEDVATVWYDDEKFQGKLVNRISQYLDKICGYQLSPNKYEDLANLIANNTYGGGETVYYDVVDTINWAAGEFNELDTSCWWGMYRHGRELFEEAMEQGEAVAIRLFREATPQQMAHRYTTKWYGKYVGAGRCFAVVDNPVDIDIIFNGYGLELGQWKNFLITAMGYTQSHFMYDSFYIGAPYVNGKNGYALYDDPALYQKASSFYEDNFYVKPKRCPDCGEKFRDRRYNREMCQRCEDKLYVILFTGEKARRSETISIPLSLNRSIPVRNIIATQDQINTGVYKKCQRATCENYFRAADLSTKKLCPHHRKPAPKSTPTSPISGVTTTWTTTPKS